MLVLNYFKKIGCVDCRKSKFNTCNKKIREDYTPPEHRIAMHVASVPMLVCKSKSRLTRKH